MQNVKRCNTEVEWRGAGAFDKLEADRPGTLLNNCSYDLWQRRYVVNQEKQGCQNPLQATQPEAQKKSSAAGQDAHRHISEWVLLLPVEQDLWFYLDVLRMQNAITRAGTQKIWRSRLLHDDSARIAKCLYAATAGQRCMHLLERAMFP